MDGESKHSEEEKRSPDSEKTKKLQQQATGCGSEIGGLIVIGGVLFVAGLIGAFVFKRSRRRFFEKKGFDYVAEDGSRDRQPAVQTPSFDDDPSSINCEEPDTIENDSSIIQETPKSLNSDDLSAPKNKITGVDGDDQSVDLVRGGIFITEDVSEIETIDSCVHCGDIGNNSLFKGVNETVNGNGDSQSVEIERESDDEEEDDDTEGEGTEDNSDSEIDSSEEEEEDDANYDHDKGEEGQKGLERAGVDSVDENQTKTEQIEGRREGDDNKEFNEAKREECSKSTSAVNTEDETTRKAEDTVSGEHDMDKYKRSSDPEQLHFKCIAEVNHPPTVPLQPFSFSLEQTSKIAKFPSKVAPEEIQKIDRESHQHTPKSLVNSSGDINAKAFCFSESIENPADESESFINNMTKGLALLRLRLEQAHLKPFINNTTKGLAFLKPRLEPAKLQSFIDATTKGLAFLKLRLEQTKSQSFIDNTTKGLAFLKLRLEQAKSKSFIDNTTKGLAFSKLRLEQAKMQMMYSAKWRLWILSMLLGVLLLRIFYLF